MSDAEEMLLRQLLSGMGPMDICEMVWWEDRHLGEISRPLRPDQWNCDQFFSEPPSFPTIPDEHQPHMHENLQMFGRAAPLATRRERLLVALSCAWWLNSNRRRSGIMGESALLARLVQAVVALGGSLPLTTLCWLEWIKGECDARPMRSLYVALAQWFLATQIMSGALSVVQSVQADLSRQPGDRCSMSRHRVLDEGADAWRTLWSAVLPAPMGLLAQMRALAKELGLRCGETE